MNNNSFIKINSKRCVHCKTCQIQCKVWNNLKVNSFGRHIKERSILANGKKAPQTMFITCLQCHEPECIKVCPTSAMHKSDLGIVMVDQDKCIGCKLCVKACPWHFPQYDPELKKAVKCDFCYERLQQGLKPACVTSCMAKALSFNTDAHEYDLICKRYEDFI